MRFGRRLLILLCAVWFAAQTSRPAVAENLPSKLSDAAYWQLIGDLSERNGYFNAENFVSNEINYQSVIPELRTAAHTGGAYLGVGPEQNFTYIAALRPHIAFIIDIRRQNLLEHLMYKSIFELSSDRADFLSRLFSRARPSGLTARTPVADLFRAYDSAQADTALFDRNLRAVIENLTKHHGFALSDDDRKGIEHVYSTFFQSGTGMNYAVGGKGGDRMPTYSELMVETDLQNRAESYLASEENYRVVRELELNNLIVPVVGDFAGPKAVREVGRYLKAHNATVTAFYLSNVESYLFEQVDTWVKFYVSVAILPIDSESLFLRSVIHRESTVDPDRKFGYTSTTLLCPIETLMDAFGEGKIAKYEDVIALSK